MRASIPVAVVPWTHTYFDGIESASNSRGISLLSNLY